MSAVRAKADITLRRQDFSFDPITDLCYPPRAYLASPGVTLGRKLIVMEAATDAEIEAALAALVEAGATALIVQNDPFFDSRPVTGCPAFSISGSFRLMEGL
jgi:hypothetical protein